jgi:hypothetical protein
MTWYRVGLVAALAGMVAGFGGPARAQGIPFGGPAYNPPVSPYLNLIRGGASPGLNYYNIVQPQIQFQSEITGLQQQTGALQAQQSAVGPGTSLATGHMVAFGNWSHYYARRGMAGIGGGMYGGMGRGMGGIGGMGRGMGMGGMGGMGMGGMGGMGMGGMGGGYGGMPR